MRLMMKHIGVAFVLGMLLTSCYGYRQVVGSVLKIMYKSVG